MVHLGLAREHNPLLERAHRYKHTMHQYLTALNKVTAEMERGGQEEDAMVGGAKARADEQEQDAATVVSDERKKESIEDETADTGAGTEAAAAAKTMKLAEINHPPQEYKPAEGVGEIPLTFRERIRDGYAQKVNPTRGYQVRTLEEVDPATKPIFKDAKTVDSWFTIKLTDKRQNETSYTTARLHDWRNRPLTKEEVDSVKPTDTHAAAGAYKHFLKLDTKPYSF